MERTFGNIHSRLRTSRLCVFETRSRLLKVNGFHSRPTGAGGGAAGGRRVCVPEAGALGRIFETSIIIVRSPLSLTGALRS